MFRAQLASSRVHRLLLVVAVLTILLGILGMHALNTHSAAGDNGHQSMSMPVDHSAPSWTTAADARSDGAPSTVGTVGAPGGKALAGAALGSDVGQMDAAGPASPEHDMGEMTMVCVFMILAAAGLALLGSLVRRRVPATFWLSTRNALTSAPRRLRDAATGASPPPVWAFSVIRC